MSKALDRALEFLNRVCGELGMGFEDDDTPADPLLTKDGEE
jgi:hypothetical protein